MRISLWLVAIALTVFVVGAGCDMSNGRPGDQAASAGGNGAFGEGTANPGEHSDQHFRDRMVNTGSDASGGTSTTPPSR